MWSSINCLSRNHCFKTRGKQVNRSILTNVRLLYDFRSIHRIGTFASKWSKEMNISILMNASLSCDFQSSHRAATFVSSWEKKKNRNLVVNVRMPCDLYPSNRAATIAPNWANKMNRSILVNVRFLCDLCLAEWITTLASKWTNKLAFSVVCVRTISNDKEQSYFFIDLHAFLSEKFISNLFVLKLKRFKEFWDFPLVFKCDALRVQGKRQQPSTTCSPGKTKVCHETKKGFLQNDFVPKITYEISFYW